MPKTPHKYFEWPQEKGESGAAPYLLLVQSHRLLQGASHPAAGPYLVPVSWWKALCHVEQHLAPTEMLLLFLNCNLGKRALPRMPPLAWKAEWAKEKRKKCSRAACKEFGGGESGQEACWLRSTFSVDACWDHEHQPRPGKRRCTKQIREQMPCSRELGSSPSLALPLLIWELKRHGWQTVVSSLPPFPYPHPQAMTSMLKIPPCSTWYNR